MTATVTTRSSKLVAVGELKPHPENPNIGDVDAIAALIEENGFVGAVIAQKSTMTIFIGEHRWRAATRVGLAKIPVMLADVDDATAKRLMLADNKARDGSKYDREKLAGLLGELNEASALAGSGYAEADLSSLLDSLNAQKPNRGNAGKEEPGAEAFIVIVQCADEAAQLALLDELIEREFECEALVS